MNFRYVRNNFQCKYELARELVYTFFCSTIDLILFSWNATKENPFLILQTHNQFEKEKKTTNGVTSRLNNYEWFVTVAFVNCCMVRLESILIWYWQRGCRCWFRPKWMSHLHLREHWHFRHNARSPHIHDFTWFSSRTLHFFAI